MILKIAVWDALIVKHSEFDIFIRTGAVMQFKFGRKIMYFIRTVPERKLIKHLIFFEDSASNRLHN